ALATVSVLFILASIIALVVETLPEARIPRPGAGAMNCSRLMVSDCLRYTQPRPAVHAVDITVTAYFALELAARLVFCPSKPEFFKSALNWIDLVAVATACVSFAVPPESAVIVHQILKVPRILRIFKLTRHFSGLKILVHTMKASSRELTLLGTVFAIFVILCGTAIFICEQFVESPVNEFRTIPIGFWWALVTMTTLGYGDMVPRTLPGYIVGGVCAISGVLVIALPVPIIVNNFALYYTHAQARLKLPKRKKRVLTRTGHDFGKNFDLYSCVKKFVANISGCTPDITIEVSDEVPAARKPEALEIPALVAREQRSPQHQQLQQQQHSPESPGPPSAVSARNSRLLRRASLRPNGHLPPDDQNLSSARRGMKIAQ
uniref:Ion_trans domain-containing protein n=1 Tax=Macrostomum lignano TaxID=282301 RepID=A0A1I8IWU2_9PLAT